MVIAARASDEIRAYYPSYSRNLGQSVNVDIKATNDTLGRTIPLAGIATMYLWPEEAGASQSNVGEDFVRRHAMRLAAQWIHARGVQGNIAELGVYQGEQAVLPNGLFPDRLIRLVDTFEGFSGADISTEAARGFSAASVGDFEDTSGERVIVRMPHADKVLVHKGMFPDSITGIEDTFALVSLDVDLYEPTLAGLEYLYPLLSQSGFIFIHDFNNLRYSGVRHAVEDFFAKTPAAARLRRIAGCPETGGTRRRLQRGRGRAMMFTTGPTLTPGSGRKVATISPSLSSAA